MLTVVISFFSEAFRPANFAAIATYAKEGTQTRSYSLNRLATNMGFAVGSAIGGIVASFSYPLLFVVDGSVSALSGLAILLLLPATAKGARKAVAEKIKGMQVRKPWEDILFVKFLLLTTMLTTCFYLMFRVVPLFYKEVWHINEFKIGLILGMNGLIIALFEMVMISRIENKRSPIHYIVKGVLFIGGAYIVLLLPGITPVTVAVLSVLLFTIGEMFALPFINTFVMSRTNEFNRGQYAAGYTLSWSVSQVIGPSAGFYLAEKYGYNWLWIMLILLLVFCASGFKLLKHKME
nr:MFS transporter [Pedobacter lusitanus]